MKLLFMKFILFIGIVFWESSALAQGYSFHKAEKLPEVINTDAEESYPLLSPDGNTLFFTRFNPINNSSKLLGSDIWKSVKDEQGNWQEAVLMHKSLNNKKHNVAIGINPLGNRLYLLNAYSGLHKTDVATYDIEFEDSKPITSNIPKINTSDGFLGLYVHPSERIILASMEGDDTYGKEDLYVMLKDSSGVWTGPHNLGPMINTSGFEISPFLTDDGKTLFFSSNGHGGFGDADIFVTHRLYDTWNVWTRPTNLGRNINSEKFDAFLTLSRDNQAYFISNKEGGFADIYTASPVIEQADSTAVRIQQLIEDAQRLLEQPRE